MGLTFKQQLTGKTLRWVIVLTLRDADKALSVREIVARVEDRYVIPGRAGKAVSASLRWEVRRGRVRQIQRDLYGAGYMPRSTEYGLRKRVDGMEPSLVATSAARTAAASERDDLIVLPMRKSTSRPLQLSGVLGTTDCSSWRGLGRARIDDGHDECARPADRRRRGRGVS